MQDNIIASEIYSGEIKKAISSVPESLDFLLSSETIENLYKLDEITRARMTAILRKYASDQRFSMKSFDDIIQAAKKEHVPETQETAPQNIIPAAKPIVLPNIPLDGLTEPGDWMIDNTGRIIKMTPNENIIACPHPVIISARLRNVDFLDEKLAISFYRDNYWSTVNVKRSVSASRTGIVSLADSGIQVTSETSKDLVTYLYELETCNADVIPCKKSVGHLGWANGNNFFPYCSDYVFDGADEYKSTISAMEPIGNYDLWKSEVNKCRNHSPIVRALIASSFSAPLLKAIDKLCYCIHIWGHTGTAKTVATYVAMSIWGQPEQLTKTFNGTAVGMEKSATFCNSIPLALDERETAKSADDFDSIIYQLTEGHSKLRGSKGGGMQPLSYWRLPILTNGEAPILSENSKSGARNRTIELNCTEPLFEDPIKTATTIKENCGEAGRQWIKFIQNEKPSVLKDFFDIFYKKLGEDKSHEDKQISSLSMIVLADYFSSIEIFGLGSDTAEREALQLGNTILSTMLTKAETDQTNNAWSFILNWITMNRFHFSAGSPEPWGIIEKDAAGADLPDVYVLSNVLSNALREAKFYSPVGVAKELKQKGLLIPSKSKGDIQVQKWICGRNTKCYHLRIE